MKHVPRRVVDSDSSELLADPVGFWDQRHAAFDPWRSGGDRGLTVAENQEFYARRLGLILDLLGRHTCGERSLRILDAGCGRGHLSAALRSCGHMVDGIDSSISAIEWAQRTHGGNFECVELCDFRPRVLYDVVICMDVLFHLLADTAWRNALSSFAHYTRAEALLILSDSFGDESFVQGNYIVHRDRVAYDDRLRACDFGFVELMPYRFGSNPNQFAAYVRKG
ncbi:MAG: methyltransferase domain-containing protein [Deltaproteobacteria bacterium]|nr:methyltransferase domain-containing protein [Deltaproteobacteria bacterium]